MAKQRTAPRTRGWWGGSVVMLAALAILAGAAHAQRGNMPPSVSLSAAPPAVALGGTTTITANASDSDGTIVRVTFFEGAVQLAQRTAPPYTLNYTPPTVGNHPIYAVALDNGGATGTSNTVVVSAAPVGNQPPVVSLSASPTDVAAGASTVLTATASDPDGTIAKVQFLQGGVAIGQATASPYKLTWTPPAQIIYTVVAVATDNFGVSTTSAPVTINATGTPTGGGGGGGGRNNAPTVSLVLSATSVAAGTSVTLTANASDVEGPVSKVEFFNGSTLISTDTTSPFSATFQPTAAGTYTLSARATDGGGMTATSSATLTVTAATGGGGGGGGGTTAALPRITLALSNPTQPATLVRPGSVVTLTGTATATATGATVSGVRFFMNGAQLANVTASPYTTTATLANPGNFDFYAVVTDSLGQTMSTLVQRTVVQNAPAVVTTDADVWRLLNQATFGASQAEAARVNALGISGWITDQMAKPISGYPDAKYNRIQLNTSADCTTTMPGGTGYPADSPQAVCARDHLTLAMVQRDFFTNATTAPDQLRQRVAWALSQIIVTSANEPDLSYAHVMSRFQNILFEEAFGNYENLLRRVTYNPAMGNYLDAVNNDRPAGTRVPNENYAREIMQLFSVGLYELNADGSLLLDASNQPIQTYDQTDIAEFARVFTGYTYASATNQTSATGKQGRYYGAPMVPYPTTSTTGHDPNAKTLLNGTTLPAGQSGQQDIDAAVRNVFMHPNTGPFVAKQLIQKLVTGNPSAKYVSDISAVFANNGSGVRGDLAAVVRAILLHPEARGPAKSSADFGQLKEPVLMVTGLIRALSGVTDGNRLEGATGNLGQRPYYSPTVFNYFMPDSKVPGTAILGPEFGIHTTVTAVGRANLVYALVYGGYAPDTTIPTATGTRLFLQQFEPLADNPAAMVSQINQVLAGGQFPAALEPTIVTAVNAIALSATPTAGERTARARMAVYLMASSYDYQVQR
ncbi:MAG: DUF1800 family protein [Burkholderiales bacterium]